MKRKTAAGIPVMWTRGNASIPHERKQTLDGFMKAVWQASRTNLHYVDFKAVFGQQLKAMYRPVKLEDAE